MLSSECLVHACNCGDLPHLLEACGKLDAGVDVVFDGAHAGVFDSTAESLSDLATRGRIVPELEDSRIRDVATLRMQKRDLLDYVTVACEARLRGQAAAAVLPQPILTELRAIAA